MRSIITKKDAQNFAVLQSQVSEPANNPDSYFQKLIKYIPAETISIYTLIQKALEQSKGLVPFFIYYIVFLIILFGNFFYLQKKQGVHRVSQLIFMSTAFIIWSYTLGEPFNSLLKSNYQPIYSTLGILIFSFIVPLFNFEK